MTTAPLHQDILNAHGRIKPYVQATPCISSIFLSQQLGQNVKLKLENLNLSGSFKIRGAANSLLSQMSDSSLVVAASAGNHAQGVAYMCNLLNLKSRIYMPELTPKVKVSATESYGAKVVLTGDIFDDAFTAASEFSQTETNSLFIHPYCDPLIIAGQGTIGLEIIEQNPKIPDVVIVPIGGGGLIGGVAIAIKERHPNVKIVGVQVDHYSSMAKAFRNGSIIKEELNPISRARSIADGISVKSVSELNYSIISKYVDEIVTVDEKMIAKAVMHLMERDHILVEGAGAASVAALINCKEAMGLKDNSNVVCLVSGGNIDASLLKRIIETALVESSRMVSMQFMIEDKPGALAKIVELMASQGANIQHIDHDRLYTRHDYTQTRVDAVVELSGRDHRERLERELKKIGVVFNLQGQES